MSKIKKANKITDCVINHRYFSCTPAEIAMLSGLGRERRGRGGKRRAVLPGAELARGSHPVPG